MKLFIKRNLHKIISVICAVLIAFTTVFSNFTVSFASEGAASWDTVGDDVLALGNSYVDYFNSWFSGDMGKVFNNAKDIPIGWLKTMSDGAMAISPVDDWFFYLSGEKKYVENRRGGVGGLVRPAEEVPPEIPSETFKTVVEKVETFYSPSGELEHLSWKNSTRWKYLEDKVVNSSGDNASEYRRGRITLMTNGKFLDKWNCVYLCPYYFDGTNIYYSSKIIFLYFDGNVAGEADFCLKVYDSLNNTISDPYTIVSGFKKSCIDINFDMDNGRSDFLCFSYADDFTYFSDNTYLSASYREGTHYGISKLCSGSSYGDAKACSHIKGISKLLNSTDIYSVLDFYSSEAYKKFLNVKTYDTVEDYGFVCSDAYFYPHVGGYTDLDVEKIPANTTVTITGDTIGDYIYTDNTTGDTTTINKYITNNYNYPDDNSDTPDDPGGGGSVSGDVTVGGTVAVGGQIEIKSDPIDINLNVSGGSSGTGTSDVVSPDISDTVNYLPENTETMKNYFSVFFDFLPPEMLALLLGGIACAILCRALGR